MRRYLRRLPTFAAALAACCGLTLLTAAPAHAETNGGVRVMPLGDSITDGFNVPGGYRINLWQRMASGGHTVDLVGSGFNGPAALGDHDHEGHSGWRIDQLDARHRRPTLVRPLTSSRRSCAAGGYDTPFSDVSPTVRTRSSRSSMRSGLRGVRGAR